jgi:diguanylate cyclase (GGDEF)-like protein
MELLEQLSEIVIDTLKSFSMEKRPLTVAHLCEAFSGKEAFLSLFPYRADDVSARNYGTSQARCGCIPQNTSEDSASLHHESFAKMRTILGNILNRLGPLVKNEYEHEFCDLKKELDESGSFTLLCELGQRLDRMVGSLVNQAVKSVDFSNDYLVELSKDLYQMEGQLFSCRTHNRETHQLNNDFNDKLLRDTEDMNQACDSSGSLEDIRFRISSKVSAISEAIGAKRQADEARIEEADAKIDELQTNLETYGREIIQIRQRADSLEKEVLLDELTQVTNRRGYDLQIRESLRRYHRDGEIFSLVLIDIDHFKRVNDEFGHRAGDKCLFETAQLIKNTLRKTDFFARYGGEELIAILPGSSARDAKHVAEKIRHRIEKARFHYFDEIVRITVSMGVTEVRADDAEPEIPFARVDEAMYQAKKDGRNRVRVNTSLSLYKAAGSDF